MNTKRVVPLLAGISLTAAVCAPLPAAASEAIIKKARCVACHHVEKKMVGPAYRDVAHKYADQADARDKLAAKVRQGGSGVWGQVPMPPHPADKIADADLVAAIDWVLQQK